MTLMLVCNHDAENSMDNLQCFKGAVVAKWSGHWPGNHKVPGLMRGINPCRVSLGKKLTQAPAVEPGHCV